MRKPPEKPRPPAPSRASLPPIDLSKLKTYPLQRRHSKVRLSDFSVAWRRGGALRRFLDSLPDILAVQTFRAVVRAIVQAHRRGAPVIVGMGAHPVKVGLNPILVDLMER
ncbi:MAG: hypothetical protein ACREI3_04780, partial [Nitrospirales bacterium]